MKTDSSLIQCYYKLTWSWVPLGRVWEGISVGVPSQGKEITLTFPKAFVCEKIYIGWDVSWSVILFRVSYSSSSISLYSSLSFYVFHCVSEVYAELISDIYIWKFNYVLFIHILYRIRAIVLPEHNHCTARPSYESLPDLHSGVGRIFAPQILATPHSQFH